MKRILYLAGPFLLAALIAACSGRGASVPTVTLGHAPWRDGERLTYNIVDRNGSTLGTSEFRLAQEGDGWQLTATDKAGQLDQTATVRLDGSTLKPLSKEKTIHRAGTDATLKITYSAGKVQINAVVNGKEQNVSIDMPADGLENDQLLMTLRALPFAQGYDGRLTDVVPDTASKVPTTVRVASQEQVTTPAGTFTAWRVELDFGQAKQTVWYAVEAPHAMVQYDNGTTRLVLAQ